MGNTLLAVMFGKIIGLAIGATVRIVAGVCRIFFGVTKSIFKSER